MKQNIAKIKKIQSLRLCAFARNKIHTLNQQRPMVYLLKKRCNLKNIDCQEFYSMQVKITILCCSRD